MKKSWPKKKISTELLNARKYISRAKYADDFAKGKLF